MKLIPVNQSEIEESLAWMLIDFAQERVKAGNVSENTSLQDAKVIFDGLLPQGVNTANNFFFFIFNLNDQKVGWLWLSINKNNEPSYLGIHNIIVFEQYRRQGWGEQALFAIEKMAKEQNISQIRLQVFGHNHPARNLYEKLGFKATTISMIKKVDV